uniref:Uncharacterized protein n=1 Tax=Ditylenchus dipsaci TaxID=166011 RepID=A0A915E896_9BILA
MPPTNLNGSPGQYTRLPEPVSSDGECGKAEKESMRQEKFFVRGTGELSALDQKINNLVACQNLPFSMSTPKLQTILSSGLTAMLMTMCGSDTNLFSVSSLHREWGMHWRSDMYSCEMKDRYNIDKAIAILTRGFEEGATCMAAAAHISKFVVNNSLFKNTEIKPLLESCRKLVGAFNHSLLPQGSSQRRANKCRVHPCTSAV